MLAPATVQEIWPDDYLKLSMAVIISTWALEESFVFRPTIDWVSESLNTPTFWVQPHGVFQIPPRRDFARESTVSPHCPQRLGISRPRLLPPLAAKSRPPAVRVVVDPSQKSLPFMFSSSSDRAPGRVSQFCENDFVIFLNSKIAETAASGTES